MRLQIATNNARKTPPGSVSNIIKTQPVAIVRGDGPTVCCKKPKAGIGVGYTTEVV